MNIFDLIFSNLVPFIVVIGLIASLKSCVLFVPQNMVYVVERFGKFNSLREAGLNIIVPFIDNVAAKHTLKEVVKNVPKQEVISGDNITLVVDGVLYFKIVDVYKAQYGISNHEIAVTELAQTTMRAALGNLEMDKAFQERDSLNQKIIDAINDAATDWGVQVMRYEISNIEPPKTLLEAMEMQTKAERTRRALILESEGQKTAAINEAEGKKKARVLAAEAEKQEQVLLAEGEAQSVKLKAEAQAEALKTVGEAANSEEGMRAAQLDLATKSIEATNNLARKSTVVLLPKDGTDASSMVAQAMTVIETVKQKSTI